MAIKAINEMLKKLNLLCFRDENIFDSQFQTANVGEFFLSVLGKNEFPYNELYIYLSSSTFENDSISESIFDTTKSRRNVSCFFDFHHYSRATAYDKRKVIVDLVFKILSKLYYYLNIRDSSLRLAYDNIMRNGLHFEWLYKNRLHKINSDYYVSINYFTDINIYKIYEVLYSSNKEEIARRCIFMDHEQIFRISNLKIIDQSKFSYSFIGPLKEFASSVDLIKHGESITDYVNTSQFFRK
jgi:hypothetical protein